MANIGAPELIIVLLVVLLLFGSTKLPKLARSLGEASKEFKKGTNEAAEEARASEASAKARPSEATSDSSVTMSRADLDALLAQREAKSSGDSSSN